MAYGSVTGVSQINSHLVGGYTASSLPTQAAVTEWLTQGAAAVNAALAKAGYSTPVSVTAACYPLIVRLNNLWAAAVAEASTNIGVDGTSETRSDKLWKQYRDELSDLLSGDLTLAGLTHSTSAPTRRGIRSLEMRRRDGYASRFDPANTEYVSGNTDDDLTLSEPWRLSAAGGKPERNY